MVPMEEKSSSSSSMEPPGTQHQGPIVLGSCSQDSGVASGQVGMFQPVFRLESFNLTTFLQIDLTTFLDNILGLHS